MKLDEESFDEFVEHIVALSHEASSLLLSHDARFEDFRSFEVWKEKNVHLSIASRNLNQIYMSVWIAVVRYLMEVAI